MNKRKFKKVLGLYKDGLSEIICITAILEMIDEADRVRGLSSTTSETAGWIVKFMEEKDHEQTT